LESAESSTLQWLREEISCHFSSWVVLNSHLPQLDPVSYKEVLNVNMPSLLAAGSLTILLEQHGTLIVLENNIVSYAITLRLKKIP
jgi:hypothetical protein